MLFFERLPIYMFFFREISFSSSSPRLCVRYSARELSKADIGATVYSGYNDIDGFDSSRVSSAVV